MQIQKHLFRIAERALQSPSASCYWKTLMQCSITLCIYFTAVFFIGTFLVLPSQNQLSNCFDKSISIVQNNFKLQDDAIYIVLPKKYQYTILRERSQQNIIKAQNQYCMIIQGLNVQKWTERPFQFTYTPNVLYFNSQQRQQFKFTNYTIILKQTSTLKNYIYGFSSLISNQLIYNRMKVFPSNPFIKSVDITINTLEPAKLQIVDKIYRIFKSIVYYVVVSIVTSLYIYGTIIAAPAVIIIFLRCSQFARNGGNMGEVYKIFPWIGMHALIRQTSQNPLIKIKSRQVCVSIILYFFFLYFVYYAIIMQIQNDLFYQKSQTGLQQIMFGFIALIQFVAIIFMRTRPFLKYYPATHTLLMLIFLFYSQFAIFGFKKIVLFAACTASCALFCYLVLQLQIPAQTSWRVGQNLNITRDYRPSQDRPRIGFMPLFNLGWINNLPDEWTLMFPLFGRENFTTRQLSFVDRNFEELDQIFNNNQPLAH